MESQRLRINQYGIDNSFATTHKDEIRLGKGGVDNAEDGEVITHEYGHAIHFSQNFAFASVEAGAISEGFGDYWAVTTTMVVRKRLGLLPLTDPACVADWDATSYDPTPPHCLRRIDSNLHYPEDLSAGSTPTAASGRGRSGTSGTRSATFRPTRSSSKASSTSTGPTRPSSPDAQWRQRIGSTARRLQTPSGLSSRRAAFSSSSDEEGARNGRPHLHVPVGSS